MGRGVQALVFASLAAGCSLAVELGGLSSGGTSAADPPRDDAGQPDPDATLPEPGDGGADARCVPGATTFCADFDTVSDVLDGWDRLRNERTNGSVVFDDALFLSAPRGARITAPSEGTASCRFTQLVRTLPGQWSRAELSFGVHVESATNAALVSLEIDDKCSVVVAPYGKDALVTRQDDPSGSPKETVLLDRRATPGKFSRIGLIFDVRGTPKIEVTIDGELAGSIAGGPQACVRSGQVQAFLGPHCVNGAVTATFDDVRLTAE